MWPNKLSPAPILGSIHGQRGHGEGQEAFPWKTHAQLYHQKSCILGFWCGTMVPQAPFPSIWTSISCSLRLACGTWLPQELSHMTDLVKEQDAKKSITNFRWLKYLFISTTTVANTLIYTVNAVEFEHQNGVELYNQMGPKRMIIWVQVRTVDGV